MSMIEHIGLLAFYVAGLVFARILARQHDWCALRRRARIWHRKLVEMPVDAPAQAHWNLLKWYMGCWIGSWLFRDVKVIYWQMREKLNG